MPGKPARGVSEYAITIHTISEYDGGLLQKTERFRTDNGDGTFSDLIERKTYTWSSQRLVSILTELFDGEDKRSFLETFSTLDKQTSIDTASSLPAVAAHQPTVKLGAGLFTSKSQKGPTT